jgi:NADPH:quinone reductase
MNALSFGRFGGPEVLEYRTMPDPVLQNGEVLVRTKAIGLNFADIYRRRGDYHLQGTPPYIAGYEAAGLVEAVSRDDLGFSVGERVAFADAPFANAELVAVAANKLIPLPADIGFETAAALLLQGMTAQYLLHDSHRLQAGQTVLVHAAAGGVGLLLVQIAKHLGAKVLGLTSSQQKAEAILAAGAAAVALYASDWPTWVQEITAGGADVAFDAVGSTLLASFAAVRTGGHVVFYGMAGGNPPAIDPRMLMDTSKSLTGGDLWNVLPTASERRRRANQLFDWVRNGQLQVQIAAKYPLNAGAAAHAFLESRASIGKVLLLP